VGAGGGGGGQSEEVEALRLKMQENEDYIAKMQKTWEEKLQSRQDLDITS